MSLSPLTDRLVEALTLFPGVGKKTTQSAVQAIFLIIIADAIFSIVFSWRGI